MTNEIGFLSMVMIVNLPLKIVILKSKGNLKKNIEYIIVEVGCKYSKNNEDDLGNSLGFLLGGVIVGLL